jgi:hypothetical protein
MELAIATVVGYLVKKLKDNKSVQDFFSDFTEGTVNWIKPYFVTKDEAPKEIIQALATNPESKAKQKSVIAAIEGAIEDEPNNEQLLKEMVAIIEKKTGVTTTSTNTLNISGNGNIANQGNTNSTITITGFQPKP